MQLVKKDGYEYWINDKGQWHGEYKRWHDNGKLLVHRFYFNDKFHGEYKLWDNNGELRSHYYYSHGELIHDLIKERVTEEDKFKLTLEHGGQWMPS